MIYLILAILFSTGVFVKMANGRDAINRDCTENHKWIITFLQHRGGELNRVDRMAALQGKAYVEELSRLGNSNNCCDFDNFQTIIFE